MTKNVIALSWVDIRERGLRRGWRGGFHRRGLGEKRLVFGFEMLGVRIPKAEK
jgi:hypothetical protein